MLRERETERPRISHKHCILQKILAMEKTLAYYAGVSAAEFFDNNIIRMIFKRKTSFILIKARRANISI